MTLNYTYTFFPRFNFVPLSITLSSYLWLLMTSFGIFKHVLGLVGLWCLTSLSTIFQLYHSVGCREFHETLRKYMRWRCWSTFLSHWKYEARLSDARYFEFINLLFNFLRRYLWEISLLLNRCLHCPFYLRF